MHRCAALLRLVYTAFVSLCLPLQILFKRVHHILSRLLKALVSGVNINIRAFRLLIRAAYPRKVWNLTRPP